MRFNKLRSSGDCGWRMLRMLACGGVTTCVLAVSIPKASANSFIFNYDYAGQPWLQAQFTDGAAGQVTLTLTALSSTETINGLYFNLIPSLSSSSLVFNPLSSGGGGFDNPTIQTGTDAFKVDGAGKFDIKFSFQNNTLAQGTAVFNISGISGLTAADFLSVSTETAGSGGSTDSSAIVATSTGTPVVVLDGVTPVPVPDGFATAILLGVGMLCIEGMRRNRSCFKLQAFNQINRGGRES